MASETYEVKYYRNNQTLPGMPHGVDGGEEGVKAISGWYIIRQTDGETTWQGPYATDEVADRFAKE